MVDWTHVCTPTSACIRFLPQTPPYQICRPSHTSPSSASEAFALLTYSLSWTSSPSLEWENPQPRFCHYTFQLLVANSSLLAWHPRCLEMNFPRGVARDVKRHSQVTRKGIHCQGSLVDTGKIEVAAGLLRVFTE